MSVAASVTRELRGDDVVWGRLARIAVSRPVPRVDFWTDELVQHGRTKLMYAARMGDIARCEWLLGLGAELEAASSEYGRTPLAWAMDRGEGGDRCPEHARVG